MLLLQFHYGQIYQPKYRGEQRRNFHRPAPNARPTAAVSVPRYKGLRTRAYGPLCARSRFFSKCPEAHARSAKPSAATGSPTAKETASGAENHRNAATMTKPK